MKTERAADRMLCPARRIRMTRSRRSSFRVGAELTSVTKVWAALTSPVVFPRRGLVFEVKLGVMGDARPWDEGAFFSSMIQS